ncbi:MATE family efflux transporter [Roseomonas sp. CAU 1739]|uniref:MATE family efflux transporter n=1 Tax=Roseomonas sp. CAU 1739 TaxID=3140364 RepID=UPI00325AB755
MSAAVAQPGAINPRTRLLLDGPILGTLLRLSWPNTLVMLAQASVGLIETWWVSHLGTDALAGIALVFPGYMLMTMLSAGAIGGGIASAVARALGARRTDDADALVLHALVVNGLLGLAFAALFIGFGRPIYAAMGGEGAALEAALRYSDVVFAGGLLLWLGNALASVLRGGGNMLLPSVAVIAGVVLLVPLSPLLIYGWGPVPAYGVAGAGYAVVLSTAIIMSVLAWAMGAGRSVARLRLVPLRWRIFASILGVGAVAAVNTVQTTLTVVLTTALVARAGGAEGVAGYGVGSRLEYLLVPLVFGLGAPLVALVGTNIGAGQRDRALRVAMLGGGIAFALTEAVGLAAAIWPEAWLGLFSDDPTLLSVGADYLRRVGPAYGFFGLGLALYFASQGAGRLLWPLVASVVRMIVAVAGGWLAYAVTGDLAWVFAAVGAAMVIYGVGLAAIIGSGAWFRGQR